MYNALKVDWSYKYCYAKNNCDFDIILKVIKYGKELANKKAL